MIIYNRYSVVDDYCLRFNVFFVIISIIKRYEFIAQSLSAMFILGVKNYHSGGANMVQNTSAENGLQKMELILFLGADYCSVCRGC